MMNGETARILFVDDEPRVLTSMRMLFRGRYELSFANSGAEALEALRENSVDVIVSDQRMPQMTGIEFLKEARQVSPDAMRILLTGYADLKAIVDSINKGEVFRFVQKPWDNDKFVSTVELAVQAARASRGITVADSLLDSKTTGKVLVLDGDSAVRARIQNILQGEAEVIAVGSVTDAIAQLESGDISVLVADTRLNGVNVTHMLGLLKKQRPELTSVIMTERADAHTAIDLINAGQIYRMIGKPINESQCRIAIRSALRQHHRLNEAPALQQRYSVETVEPPPESVATPAHQQRPNEDALSRLRRLRRSISAN